MVRPFVASAALQADGRDFAAGKSPIFEGSLCVGEATTVLPEVLSKDDGRWRDIFSTAEDVW